MSTPPVLPLAPAQYDSGYMNRLNRILVQYLTQIGQTPFAMYLGVNSTTPQPPIFWSSGTGTPEGVVAAPVGSLYSRLDGGATTSLYVKTSGTGSAGWTAK